MKKGKISLQRENSLHHAGYCIIREKLSALTDYMPMLHPEEQAHYNTFRFDKRRSTYLLGRIAAKQAIHALTSQDNLHNIAIGSGVFQFPVVKYNPQGNLQVCISHCDELGIALSYPEEHPLGIDIEIPDPSNVAALKEQLTDAEILLASAQALPEATGFTMAWTIKEALSKILRTGLTIDLKLLEIKSLQKQDGVYVSDFRHLIQYKAVSCIAGDYICTVVMPGKTTTDLRQFWEDLREIV